LALYARRATRLVAFAAVVGPAVLAGVSDDDPAASAPTPTTSA
jgi:hypothetical protein